MRISSRFARKQIKEEVKSFNDCQRENSKFHCRRPTMNVPIIASECDHSSSTSRARETGSALTMRWQHNNFAFARRESFTRHRARRDGGQQQKIYELLLWFVWIVNCELRISQKIEIFKWNCSFSISFLIEKHKFLDMKMLSVQSNVSHLFVCYMCGARQKNSLTCASRIRAQRETRPPFLKHNNSNLNLNVHAQTVRLCAS